LRGERDRKGGKVVPDKGKIPRECMENDLTLNETAKGIPKKACGLEKMTEKGRSPHFHKRSKMLSPAKAKKVLIR